ncbi:Ribosomal N-lysine methyltransferase 3 [Termitomyces sp. T112]|nr:Ribosomal N-lysine methyltransferase 3 [Termitomyces sp. T112]
MALASAVSTLVRWCTENDIWIDPRLEIRSNEENCIAVYAKDKHIPAHTCLVLIHRDSVISVRSCSLSKEIEPVFSGPPALLSLTLALYVEILNGETSRWFGYIQSLPRKPIPIPLFWAQDFLNVNHTNDGKKGLQWLEDTEIGRRLTSDSSVKLEDIDGYFNTVAEPLLLRYFNNRTYVPATTISLEGFYHAYSLVSSRAFLVDGYHGLSMVPIADSFNHSHDNHVHLETEFDVCSQCGSLHECPHDAYEVINQSMLYAGKIDPTQSNALVDYDSYYEMVSNAEIMPGEEVFNTYGEGLSNAQLLARYGFTLDVNDNDHIYWDLSEVLMFCTDRSGALYPNLSQMEAHWMAVVHSVGRDGICMRLPESSLIYFHEGNENSLFCLDSDGKVSHQLWALLALPLCLRGDRGSVEEQIGPATAELRVLLEYQLALEGVNVENIEQLPKNSEMDVILAVARSIVSLCSARKSQLEKKLLLGSGDLNEVLDNTPINMQLTREALTFVIGESSILDSCISAWEEFFRVH